MAVPPIFIFSLPRCGSTLLQRILAVHPDIETKSEMWFLLPLIYTLKDEGVYAQYSSVSLNNAITYLLSILPKGKQDYFDAIRLFSERIYSRLPQNNERYVLDKTPRYYLIINEIENIFPDAKFIFLFRHPLSMLASLIESFYNGKLGDWRHKIDIYKGPFMLAQGYKAIRNKSIAIQYESLLDHPEDILEYVCDYLSIPYSKALIEDFHKIPLTGLGDKFGSKEYNRLEKTTKNKWKIILGTRYRKWYAMKYIKYLGEDTISTFGYDMDEILMEINELKPRLSGTFQDIFNQMICSIKSFIELPMLKKKIKDNLLKKDKYYVHY